VGFFNKSRRPRVDCSNMPSRTVQSEKASCDINNIVRQYRRTGVLPHMAARMPEFGDVSEVGDFREAVERVRATEAWFSKLPAAVRAKFQNDPIALMDAVGDPSREPELKALGLFGEEVEAAKAELEKAAAGSPPA